MRAERIEGGVFRDRRGVVRFANGFDLSPVKRMYAVRNSLEKPFRGWIVHHRERKWFWPSAGKARIHVVRLDDRKVFRFDIDADDPAVLAVEGAYALGIEARSGDCEVTVFSDCTVKESASDMERLPEEAYPRG